MLLRRSSPMRSSSYFDDRAPGRTKDLRRARLRRSPRISGSALELVDHLSHPSTSQRHRFSLSGWKMMWPTAPSLRVTILSSLSCPVSQADSYSPLALNAAMASARNPSRPVQLGFLPDERRGAVWSPSRFGHKWIGCAASFSGAPPGAHLAHPACGVNLRMASARRQVVTALHGTSAASKPIHQSAPSRCGKISDNTASSPRDYSYPGPAVVEKRVSWMIRDGDGGTTKRTKKALCPRPENVPSARQKAWTRHARTRHCRALTALLRHQVNSSRNG